MAENEDRDHIDEQDTITPGIDVKKLKKKDQNVGKKKTKTTAF
ncbi:MAG: hypothetical protein A4E53_01254 [Pelotomaculum sp. PtaB.Bin104]|nr:MAG: hypothetical protein A4E53_01254 [Pelotomaculum sp. PtaB.Bin104]